MLAAVARDRRLHVEEVPEPIPGPGDALVAVRVCGICGSDLHALGHAESLVEMSQSAGQPLTFDPTDDFVMGHEYCAEVLELGPETAGAPVSPGDLVVSIPAALTANGLEAIGYSNRYGGGYAERIRVTAGMCLRVPDGLDPRRAALTEPMAVGLHAVNLSGVRPGDAAVVVGCGPIGLAVIASLRLQGIEPVVAADYSPRRRDLAGALGAHEVVDPAEEPALDAWRHVDGVRPLVVYEAVGVPGMLDALLRDTPSRARLLVVGVCMETDHVRPMFGIIKELALQFSFGYDPMEFSSTLAAIAEGRLDVTPIVTATVGVEGVPAAFDALARPDEHVKILVEPGGPLVPTSP